MSSLVLDYHVSRSGGLQLTPFWREPGVQEQPWATHPELAAYPEVLRLSRQIQAALAGGVKAICSGCGQHSATNRGALQAEVIGNRHLGVFTWRKRGAREGEQCDGRHKETEECRTTHGH